jgi:hypothetical protein
LDHRVEADARALLAPGSSDNSASDRVDASELQRLPPPVQRWLRAAGVVGHRRAHTVRLQQRGLLRTRAGQHGMPASAEQYFNVDEPGFVWHVDTRMGGIIPVSGCDRYLGGAGRMQIALGALVNVVDAAGPAIDQGALLRFLGETVWFPSAALQPYIHWTEHDARSATATMSWGGASGSLLFTFDEHDRLVRLSGMRHLGADAKARPRPWVIRAVAWKKFDGIEVPARGNVSWQLEAGDFDYYDWQLTAIDFNPARPYAR